MGKKELPLLGREKDRQREIDRQRDKNRDSEAETKTESIAGPSKQKGREKVSVNSLSLSLFSSLPPPTPSKVGGILLRSSPLPSGPQVPSLRLASVSS